MEECYDKSDKKNKKVVYIKLKENLHLNLIGTSILQHKTQLRRQGISRYPHFLRKGDSKKIFAPNKSLSIPPVNQM